MLVKLNIFLGHGGKREGVSDANVFARESLFLSRSKV